MPSVSEAIDTLKEALKKRGVEKHTQDVSNHVASCLVLLNSSSPSTQMIKKLCTVLHQPLLPLYNACLQPALQFSSSVLSTVLGRLCDAQNAKDEKLHAAWDETAKVILSGVLDFLERWDGAAESDGADWKLLCHIICDSFLHGSTRGLPTFSVPLCLSAYNTLTEIASKQAAIQNILRHRDALGGERLGAAISRTRDYLLLEALLIMFARLLPPIYGPSQGKLKRTQFVKEVLGSPQLFKCTEELLEIMRNTTGVLWDDVSAQIIDALARSDITYPQPFSIDEIDVCGRVFPQPLATDRLIMDKQAFLANIVIENVDLCESLQVPYSFIRAITLDSSKERVPKGKVLIVVYLTSPPLVANAEMKPLDQSNFRAKFFLEDNAVGRFMEALRRRGVGKLSFLSPLAKMRRRHKSISIGLGLKFISDSSPTPPAATFEGKVERVNQVYKTDIEDSSTFEAIQGADLRYCPVLDPGPKPRSEEGHLVPETNTSGDVLAIPNGVGTMFSSETLKPAQNSTPAFARLRKDSTKSTSQRLPLGFGNNGDFSEISEFDDSNTTINERTVPLVCHGLKQTRPNLLANQTPSTMGFFHSSEFVLKMHDHTAQVTQRSPRTHEPPSTGGSPIFGSSSSTQINGSPEPQLDVDTLLPFCVEAMPSPRVVSKDCFGKGSRHRDTVSELIIVSTANPPGHSGSAENEPERHSTCLVPSSSTAKDFHPTPEATKDTAVPLKVAGSRRKREIVKPSVKATVSDDDAFTPRKKPRHEKRGAKETKSKANETLSEERIKGSTQTSHVSHPNVVPTTFDFDGPQGSRSTCQGTRRSSRIKRSQMAAKGGTRADVMHNKGDTQQSRVTELNSLVVDSLPDTGLDIPRSGPVQKNTVSAPPFRSTDGHAHLVELNVAENISSRTNLSQEVLKTSIYLPRERSSTSTEDPTSNFVQQTHSNAIQLIEGQPCIKTEQTIGDPSLPSDLRIMDETIGCSISGNESVSPEESSRPLTGLETGKRADIVGLTIDESLSRENEVHEASLELYITGGEPTFFTSPRRRGRNVTFASPIEYVLDEKVKVKSQVSSSSRRSPLSFEKNVVSPLRIPVKPKSDHYPYTTATKPTDDVEGFVQNQATDEFEIQTIMDVLNEIHAVIIKGVSDRFRFINKDVQYGWDVLIQQVVDELQDMVIENAKYFNGLARLEEGYYKHGKAITHCWEELIDCNDGIAAQFQNTVKEHDQYISARAFPKSLQHMHPAFVHHHQNA